VCVLHYYGFKITDIEICTVCVFIVELLNEMLRWLNEPSKILHLKMNEVFTGLRGIGVTFIAIYRRGEELQI
jgi:hypothetical protein